MFKRGKRGRSRIYMNRVPAQCDRNYMISASCSNCIASANPLRTLKHVSFCSVYYCSGQSNMVGCRGAWLLDLPPL